MCSNVIGFKGEGLQVAFYRFIQLSQFFERCTKVIVRLRVIRFYRESLVVTCNGLIQLSQSFERVPEITMRL